MWGSHQFHPYNSHCQELVEDQRSKLTNEDAAWYSEIILHAEPKARDPSHPKVQQQSSSVRFFLWVLRLLYSEDLLLFHNPKKHFSTKSVAACWHYWSCLQHPILLTTHSAATFVRFMIDLQGSQGFRDSSGSSEPGSNSFLICSSTANWSYIWVLN